MPDYDQMPPKFGWLVGNRCKNALRLDTDTRAFLLRIMQGICDEPTVTRLFVSISENKPLSGNLDLTMNMTGWRWRWIWHVRSRQHVPGWGRWGLEAVGVGSSRRAPSGSRYFPWSGLDGSSPACGSSAAQPRWAWGVPGGRCGSRRGHEVRRRIGREVSGGDLVEMCSASTVVPSLRWSTHWMLWWLPLHWAQTAWLVQLRVEWPKPWQLWHCLALDVDDVDDLGVVVVALGRLPGWDSVWLVSWDRRCRLLLLAVFQPSSREASSGVEAAGAGRWSSGAGAAGAENLSSSRDVFFAVFLGVLVFALVLLPRRGWGCVIAGTALPTRGSSSRLSRSSTHRWKSEVRWSRRACRSEVERRMVVLLIWRSREKCATQINYQNLYDGQDLDSNGNTYRTSPATHSQNITVAS